MRCPSCGAANPDEASWCGLCFADLRPAPVEPEPPTAETEDAVVLVAAPESLQVAAAAALDARTPPGAEAIEAVGIEAAGGAVRRVGDRLEWICATCATVNPMDSLTCTVCGASLAELFKTEGSEGSEAGKKDPEIATILSAILPGAGHFYAGRHGDGFARAVLFLTSFGFGIGLLAQTSGKKGAGLALVVEVPFFLAALGIWAVTLVDARSATRGGRQIITTQILFYTTLALTGLLVLGVLVLAMKLSGSTLTPATDLVGPTITVAPG